jgi:hypothetical protein
MSQLDPRRSVEVRVKMDAADAGGTLRAARSEQVTPRDSKRFILFSLSRVNAHAGHACGDEVLA